MAITYNAGTNVITVTAYTEGTPCNLTDVYNADVAGSWGVVTRQCTSQFCFDAGLKIGDGSTATWFADSNKQIKFTSGCPQEIVEVTANGNFRLGEIVSGKITKNGCSLISDKATVAYIRGDTENNGTAKINIYSCLLSSIGAERIFILYATLPKVYNCIFTRNTLFNICKQVDYYNVLIDNVNAGIRASTGTFDKITINGATFGALYVGNTDFNMSNVYGRNNTYVAYLYSDFDGNGYLINPDFDTWAFNWEVGSYGKVWRQYEFDLKVIDKDNVAINAATVKIWDKDSNLIVDTTTNASGVIATQTITRGYYNQANGDTLQEASPHLIKIEKADYTTYEADFTLGDKTDWLIALQAAGGGLMRNPPLTGGMV